MKNILVIFVTSLFFILAPTLTDAIEFQGRVVGVIDGDTIKVLQQGKQVKVRLVGIDCPEKDQPYGQKAKSFVMELIAGKSVIIKYESYDRYGRIVGAVFLSDGRNLNHELVQTGLAWWYRKYAPNDKTLVRLEYEARKAKLGLWTEPNPVSPWEWRRGVREGRAPPSSEIYKQYHGNVKSQIFHRPGCRWYNCKNCVAVFETKQSAIKAGYRPCKVCKP